MKESINLKVEKAVYYERVSTTHDAQKDSLENQSLLKKTFLNKHPEIECVATFSETISGKSDLRPEYQKMIEYITQHDDVRYIMVKDTKRMFRSTEVAAQFKHFAKKHRIQLILLSTSEVFDVNSNERRLLYSIDAMFNEEYTLKQSEYGRIAHRQKMEVKRLNRNNVTFGYYWDNESRQIKIDPEQAEIIRNIYDMYVFRNLSNSEIRKYLAECGYPRSSNTVTNYLQDTSYIGKFNMNKKGSELGVGVGQKTIRFDLPKEEWVTVDVPELAIVNADIFALAQEIREYRSSLYFHGNHTKGKQSRFRGSHLFAGKVFCGYCGNSYLHTYADRARTKHAYRDSFDKKNTDPNATCKNPIRRVMENDLIDLTLHCVNVLIKDNKECFDKILPAIMKAISNTASNEDTIARLEKEIAALERKKEKARNAILELDGALSTDFIKDYNRLDAQITEIQTRIDSLKKEDSLKESVVERGKKIKAALQKMKDITISKVDRNLVEDFIDRIIIGPDKAGKDDENIIHVIMRDARQFTYKYGSDSKAKLMDSASPLSYESDDLEMQKKRMMVCIYSYYCELQENEGSKHKCNVSLEIQI